MLPRLHAGFQARTCTGQGKVAKGICGGSCSSSSWPFVVDKSGLWGLGGPPPDLPTNTRLRVYQFLVEISTTECSEAPSATRKVAMEKSSAKHQPPQTRLSAQKWGEIPMAFWNMKHGRLASEVPKGFFRAVFGVPRMRASVCSVVTLQYAFPLISLKN